MIHRSHWESIVNNIEIFFREEIENIIKNSVIIDDINEYGYIVANEKKQDNKILSLISRV